MNDYPTKMENAPDIEDAQDWLQTRSTSEVAEDSEDLHAYQLEWLAYEAESDNSRAVLRAELNSRGEDAYGDKGHYTQTRNTSSRSTGRTSGGSVWDSGLEIVDNFGDLAEELIGARSLEDFAKQELGLEKNKVNVPEEVRKVCVALQNEVNDDYGGGCEFGVLFKGEWTSEGFQVKPDYVVPEQKVSKAHITYTEDLKKYRDEGYIVNVHSHPWAGQSSSFSGTDDDHINSHFDVALLFGGGAETIVGGIANLETDDGLKIQVNPEIDVEEPEEKLPEVDIEDVETKNRRTGNRGNSKSSRQKSMSRYHDYKGVAGRPGYKNSGTYEVMEADGDNTELPESWTRSRRQWLPHHGSSCPNLF